MIRLRSRYALHKERPLYELERHLMRLSRQGVLRSAVIYFGTTTDPFFPFEGKFDASMKFLELFRRYTPGMLHVQTRSPLIVLALPVFKTLAKHVSVTIGLETALEESVQRYTPGLPRVEERLKTATALRKFGIEVALQVSPVLPYGDWRKDAGSFAELLNKHADYIFVNSDLDSRQPTSKGAGRDVARRLAADRKFHWLRPDASQPLVSELTRIAPQKLEKPKREQLGDRQMKIFAA
jgi:DNA repair photolyase